MRFNLITFYFCRNLFHTNPLLNELAMNYYHINHSWKTVNLLSSLPHLDRARPLLSNIFWQITITWAFQSLLAPVINVGVTKKMARIIIS